VLISPQPNLTSPHLISHLVEGLLAAALPQHKLNHGAAELVEVNVFVLHLAFGIIAIIGIISIIGIWHHWHHWYHCE
jgi:hypothetical protein